MECTGQIARYFIDPNNLLLIIWSKSNIFSYSFFVAHKTLEAGRRPRCGKEIVGEECTVCQVN